MAKPPGEDQTINLASGGTLDFADLRAVDIRLEDIAGALSRICRFAGQASRFHSVAQHAVLVHDLVVVAGHPELAMAALHHDSHEAYACDIPAPLKRRMRAEGETIYDDVCDQLDDVIGDSFGFAFPDTNSPEGRIIKAADNRALVIEATILICDRGQGISEWLADRDEPVQTSEWTLAESLAPADAADRFTAAHRRLRPD